MNIKFTWLIVAMGVAALVTLVQANSHNNGGGNFTPAVHSGASRSGSSVTPMRSFSGRMYGGGQRFSSIGTGVRPTGVPSSFRQQHFVGSNVAGQHLTGGNRLARTGNANRIAGGGQNHVFARHSANWQPNWDRHHDHFWHGHRCRFVNGSWFIFDFGFDPWWWYGYPYYGYDGYYPYGYDPSSYGSEYYGDNYGDSATNESGDSGVAAAQERLAREGYYRGAIDGVFGEQTRRALVEFQRAHGLSATGYLTRDTRSALGLRPG